MEGMSVQEKTEMVLIYGECGRNIDDAVTLYAQRFPDRERSCASFFRVVKQFTTEGSVQPKKRKRRATVTGENNEIAVLAAVANNRHVSTREIARDLALSQTSVCKILKRHKYHPYHVSMHQELHGDDFHNRVTFCQWALEQKRRNPDFFRRVLFFDESAFTNHGTVNRHNMHYWSVENPHWLRQVEHQRPWSIKRLVWINWRQTHRPLFH
ncbi:uncharacterized protein LOC113562216 [Ooceraea biroi]|uniref:uncharacterized protein LOC113562216 n=1 Tax=Ooceraea biroi TaxID=2015173 RepID=UPI000F0967F9|nr:uncharacterized protein LOC113562216 [Ooceraea biroi]